MTKKRVNTAFLVANWSVAAVLALVLLIPFSLTGCGKKGLPEPDYSEMQFAFADVTASVNTLGCVNVSGTVAGEEDFLNFIVLELQVYDSSCAGCPFVPQERHRVNASEFREAPGSDKFSFAYCPAASSDTYRWRLVGHSVYIGQPTVVGPVRTVSNVMDLRD